MMGVLYDFTGANGSPIPAGLTAISGSAEIQNNKLVGTNGIIASVITGVGVADDTVKLDFNSGGSLQGGAAYSSGVAFRVQDISNYWLVSITPSNGRLRILKFEGGAASVPASYDIPSFSLSATYTIEVTFLGRDISVKLNDVPISALSYTHTNNFLITAVNHGMRIATTIPTFDNLNIGESVATPLSLQFSLVGGVSDVNADILGRVSTTTSTLKIEHADNPAFTDSTLSPLLSVDADLLVKHSLSGLTLSTQYYYRYVDDNVVVAGVFKFKTTTVNSQYSFTIGFGGCARAAVNSVAFGRLKDRNLEFFQSLGDTTYIDSQDVTGVTQKNAWFAWLARSDVRELMDNTAYSYMWDDHDYGNNDDDATNPAKVAQQANFRNLFPSHTLRQSSGSVGYAYTIGRIRFIVPDLRSERTATEIMSTAQMDWVKQEFTDYSNNNALNAVVFVSSSMWLDIFSAGTPDSWNQAVAQRLELSNHIINLGVKTQVVCLSADMHSLGADTGASNTYGTSESVGFPVYHSAPLAGTNTSQPDQNLDLGYVGTDNGGSLFQYATLEIVDTGLSIDIIYRGFNAVADTQVITNTLSIAADSTFNLVSTNTPDGSYLTDFYNDTTKSLIETKQLVFSGGGASTTLPVPIGNSVLSHTKGSNPPTTGIDYLGVTE